jgi:hypothetical protein
MNKTTFSRWFGDKEFSGCHPTAEYDEMLKRLRRMSLEERREAWALAVGGKIDREIDPWYLDVCLKYWALHSGWVRTGEVPDAVARRWKACLEHNWSALAKESDFLTKKYTDRGGSMSRKSDKATKSKRVTAGDVLIGILSRANVPADEVIIAEVKEATGSSKFDEKQLAWYKWKFRLGKLKGMDGKQHVINQGDAKKPAKAGKKKIVVKKKKK